MGAPVAEGSIDEAEPGNAPPKLAKLGPAFEKAMANVLARCEKAEATNLLLLVRIDAGLDEVPADLVETLAATIEDELAGHELVVTRLAPDAEQEDGPLPERPRRMLGTRELHTVAEAHEFDVLLTATFRETRGEPSLRIAMFDRSRRMSLEHVAVGAKQVQAAVAQFGTRSPRVPAGVQNGRLGRGVSAAAAVAGLGNSSSAVGRGGSRSNPGSAGGTNRPGNSKRPNAPKVDPDDKAPKDDGGNGDKDEPGDGTPEPPPAGNPTGLNAAVLRFAQQNLGRQVGNGECWTLANDALVASGAQPAAGYTFGAGIDRKSVTPGDILQFKSVRLERGNQYWTLGLPDHTAIVEATKGDVVTVLHQNFGGRTVTRFTMDFDDMVRGEVRAYRPRAR